jgi:signal transduction histidine kinase
MRTRSSFLLSAVAFAQILLLGASLAILVIELRKVRADLIRFGQEEQAFQNQLTIAESDLYRTSILLRDEVILDGTDYERANQELKDLLHRISDQAIHRPPWISAPMRAQLDTIDSTRAEYLTRARVVASWQEKDRKRLGLQYLRQQLTPMRLKFTSTARQINDLTQTLRDTRNHAMAESIDGIQALVVRTLIGAALFGLALAGVAGFRFRDYERDRDAHTRHVEQAEDRLRTLSQRLVEAQELERKNLSRELHDEVGQTLTALRVQMGQIEPAGDASANHLAQASALAERSLRSIREMARGLRPAMLDDLGLGPAITWLGRDFSKNTALEVDVQIEGELIGLSEPLRTCSYRIVQEALTNCVKHARATGVRVLLHESPAELVLTIQDNGTGFAAEGADGIGLLGMRERVEELNGEFAVVSSPGAGTLVRAILPKAKMEKT